MTRKSSKKGASFISIGPLKPILPKPKKTIRAAGKGNQVTRTTVLKASSCVLPSCIKSSSGVVPCVKSSSGNKRKPVIPKPLQFPNVTRKKRSERLRRGSFDPIREQSLRHNQVHGSDGHNVQLHFKDLNVNEVDASDGQADFDLLKQRAEASETRFSETQAGINGRREEGLHMSETNDDDDDGHGKGKGVDMAELYKEIFHGGSETFPVSRSPLGIPIPFTDTRVSPRREINLFPPPWVFDLCRFDDDYLSVSSSSSSDSSDSSEIQLVNMQS